MIPSDLKFTKTHEWARVKGGLAEIGITQFAVEQLGDIVFVELPAVGKKVTAGAPFGVIESVKAAVELISPVSGEVAESNATVTTDFTAISEGPYDKGWMIKVRLSNPSEVDGLMGPGEYEKFVETEQHH